MLNLRRKQNEDILIGDADSVIAALTPTELIRITGMLRGSGTPGDLDLANRLGGIKPGPLGVRVSRLSASSAEIGIAAPKSLPIRRREIYAAVFPPERAGQVIRE